MSNQKVKRPSTFTSALKRLFVGSRGAAGNEAMREMYDSPSKQAVKRFFRKPLATGALIVLISMMLFVFIAPSFFPIDLSYSEALHTNVAPTMSLLKIPAAMQKNPISISSKGTFTVGVDSANKLHIWGYFFSFNKNKDVKNIPEEVKNGKIAMAAAGTDHVVAIGTDGTVYAWGEYDNAQYGDKGRLLGEFPQPKELMEGKLDVENIQQLLCGDQMTAILMKDGTLYAWGNAMANCMNLDSIFRAVKNLRKEEHKLTKLVFTNTSLFGITDDGRFIAGNNSQYQYYKGTPIAEYIGSRKVVDAAATGDSICLILDDSELMSFGTINSAPEIPDGERAVSVSGGSRHFVLLTESGKLISWGANALGQTDVPKKLADADSADRVFASGFQNYAFKDGTLSGKWGHKGYLMGTDNLGRDIFVRVINGGRLTMTIGAVAVIVSSIIGIIIGCISGYFGGAVDLLLMRITEIFSAIPFLPFALVLSAVLQGSDVKEDTRIFIIMIVLGLLSWTGLAKLVRAQILAEREKEFVLAAKSMGIKEGRIAFKHILPNVVSVIIVSLTLDFATCMLTESSLSYLGFGVKLPRPSWGNMLNGCNDSIVIQNFWWRWLFPALFLAVTVICINIIGDTLRDILDPKSEVEK